MLFFDELPWLASQKSGFLEAFGYFWNSWASRQNLVIVICGSAASWMIQQVVNDKGGLHNRITKNIHLEPFTLAETEVYLQSRNAFFDRYQIIQIYMALGGKQVNWIFITTFGVVSNQYAAGLVTNVLTMNDLFA